MRPLGGSVEPRRDHAMQLHPLRGEQPLVDDFADQAMPEREPVALAHEHPGVQRGAQRVRVDRERVEQRERCSPAGRRERGQRVRVESLDPREHRLRQRLRPRLEQLLDEERVAARARVQLVDQRRGDRAAGERLELLCDVVPPERRQLDPQHRPAPPQLPGEPAQVLGERVVHPVGREHDDRLRAQVAGEERQQHQRRAVSPVDVLEHEQHRAVECAEQVEQQLVQPPRAAPARRLARKDRRQRGPRLAGQAAEVRLQPVGGEVAQRRHDRRVRQLLTAELDALSVQDEPAVRGRLQLRHQPRLADPGLAGDQRDARRRGERGLELAQRPLTSDHRPVLHRSKYPYPRPIKGIFVAITVIDCTLASSGSDAM